MTTRSRVGYIQANPLAKAVIATVFLYCPHCGEGIADPLDGSFLIPVNAGATDRLHANERHECDACGKSFRVPSIVG